MAAEYQTSVAAPHNLVSDRHPDVQVMAYAAGQVPIWNAATNRFEPGFPGGGAHNIISATHADTGGGAPADQNVLVWIAAAGQWQAKVIPLHGATHEVLGSDPAPSMPTVGQKAALPGTSGAPGAGNKYVTDTDPRNSNARTPTAHAASHNAAGADVLAAFGGDAGAGGTVGYVPAPAAGDAAAGKFLKADGTFAVPSASIVRLAEVVVGAGGAANITFSNIPGTYRDLRITGLLRTNDPTVSQSVGMQFNADAGANYDWAEVYGSNLASGGEGAFGVTSIVVHWIVGSAATASYAAPIECTIVRYADTNWHKTVFGGAIWGHSADGSHFFSFRYTGRWRSTVAITSIVATPSNGSFVQNSVLTLWGIV